MAELFDLGPPVAKKDRTPDRRMLHRLVIFPGGPVLEIVERNVVQPRKSGGIR